MSALRDSFLVTLLNVLLTFEVTLQLCHLTLIRVLVDCMLNICIYIKFLI